MTPYKDYELFKWLHEETYNFFKNDKDKFKIAFHFHKGELIK